MKTIDLLLDWIDVSVRSKLRWCYYGPGGAAIGLLVVAALVIWFCTRL